MIILLKTALCVCVCVCGVTSSSSDKCQTPDKQQGECKPFKECLFLYSLLDNLTDDTVTYLRKFHCGFDKQHPKVCCVNESAIEEKENVDTTILKHSLLPGQEICGLTLEDKNQGPNLYVDQYSWTALLIYQENNQTKIYCSGTLISNRYVLTAAQCINRRNVSGAKLVSVRLGEKDFTTDPDCDYFPGGSDCGEPFIEVPIEKTIIHEDYQADDVTYRHDIALIRLNETMSFNDFVQPLCLPSTNNVHKKYTKIRLIQFGWGINNKKVPNSAKTKTDVIAQNNQECNNIFGFELNQSQLCTKKFQIDKSCSVDVGGSVISFAPYVINGNYYGVAVVSVGTCDGDQPTLYTKVADYSDWIVSKLEH